MSKEDLYLKLPFPLQAILVNVQGYLISKKRYNTVFKSILKQYLNSNPDNVDKNSLRDFIKKVGETPFWKKRIEDYGVRPDSNIIIKEISKLPILSKEEVKENLPDIINENIDEKTEWVHTSGTTGSGLVFPQTYSMENKQWAIWWRYRSWHCINPNTWLGWFGGRSILNIDKTKPPYWHVNHPMKQVMFSAHHLNHQTVNDYHSEIKGRKLPWIHGYPSQLSLLAHLIKEQNLGKLPDLKIITVGAENLLYSQRKIMEEVFEAPVKQHYGLMEGVANISETAEGNLIPDQDFCYVEFIPLDNSNPSKCRIVGTNYNNPAFPLIRYDTGDVANILWNKDGSYNILSIDGRQEDFVTLPSGVKLGRLDHIFKDLTEVKEAQIYQPDIENVIIRVVKGKNYDKINQESNLLREAHKRLGEEINISIDYLDNIPKTISNKLRFVISDI